MAAVDGMIEFQEIRRRDNSNQMAFLHQPDSGAEKRRFTNIVRHKNHRFSKPPMECPEFVLNLRAGDRIERAEWLIEQQDRRVRRKRPRHADALPLAARELARKSFGDGTIAYGENPDTAVEKLKRLAKS